MLGDIGLHNPVPRTNMHLAISLLKNRVLINIPQKLLSVFTCTGSVAMIQRVLMLHPMGVFFTFGTARIVLKVSANLFSCGDEAFFLITVLALQSTWHAGHALWCGFGTNFFTVSIIILLYTIKLVSHPQWSWMDMKPV